MNLTNSKRLILVYSLFILIYFIFNREILNTILLIIPCILISTTKTNKKNNDLEKIRDAINNIPGFKKEDAEDLSSYIDAVNEYTTKLRSELRFHKRDSKKMEEELFRLKEKKASDNDENINTSDNNNVLSKIINRKNNDLKNIIASFKRIKDTCNRFLSSDDALLLDNTRSSLNKIQNDFLKMITFIDLLNEKIVPENKRFSISGFYNDLKEDIAFISDKKNVKVVFRDDTEGKKVSTDKSLLKKVLFELVENSVNSSSAGSTVILKSALTSETVEISIIDSGRGCSKKDIPSSLNDVKKDRIGLNIVLGICDLLDHEIRFIHNPQDGMTVKLSI